MEGPGVECHEKDIVDVKVKGLCCKPKFSMP